MPRGPAELPLSTLRQQALFAKQGAADVRAARIAGRLFLAFHERLALAAAPLLFALLGLAAARFRTGAGVKTVGAPLACAAYVYTLFWVGHVEASALADERAAFALAWLPNVSIILTTLTLLAIHRRPQPPPECA